MVNDHLVHYIMRDLVGDWRHWSLGERISAIGLACGLATLLPILIALQVE